MSWTECVPQNHMVKSDPQYEQYLEERGKCNKIRLTCQVNPICSNVLYNSVTEIVRNEGSDDVEVLNYGNGTIEKGNMSVGKTRLLQEFCKDKKFFYYLARACSEREQCCQWAGELRESGKEISKYPDYEELLQVSLD